MWASEAQSLGLSLRVPTKSLSMMADLAEGRKALGFVVLHGKESDVRDPRWILT